jgi:hypothetical protein
VSRTSYVSPWLRGSVCSSGLGLPLFSHYGWRCGEVTSSSNGKTASWGPEMTSMSPQMRRTRPAGHRDLQPSGAVVQSSTTSLKAQARGDHGVDFLASPPLAGDN